MPLPHATAIVHVFEMVLHLIWLEEPQTCHDRENGSIPRGLFCRRDLPRSASWEFWLLQVYSFSNRFRFLYFVQWNMKLQMVRGECDFRIPSDLAFCAMTFRRVQLMQVVIFCKLRFGIVGVRGLRIRIISHSEANDAKGSIEKKYRHGFALITTMHQPLW